MDRYQVLTTTTKQPFVNRASEALERAGIPLMVEHVEVNEDGGSAIGFRVLVPDQYTQSAMRLIDAANEVYM